MIPPWGYGMPGWGMGMPPCPPGWAPPPGYMPGYDPYWGAASSASGSEGLGGGGNSLWEEKMAQMSGMSGGSSKWDAGPAVSGPSPGTVLNGTIKSYSSMKGYGFIVSHAIKQDVWFADEAIDSDLRSSDLCGEQVSFELMRAPDGKPQARRMWRSRHPPPMMPGAMAPPKPPPGIAFMGKGGPAVPFAPTGMLGCRDGSRVSMGKGSPGSIDPMTGKRALSPHAGSRAMKAGFGAGEFAARSRSRSRPRSPSSSSKSSSKSSSSSSSSHKKKKKRKKKEKARSPSSQRGEGTAAEESQEVKDAKLDALQKLTDLQKVEPKEKRAKEYRALLRVWHPDKNPDKLEAATAVFQFLQKGKKLLSL